MSYGGYPPANNGYPPAPGGYPPPAGTGYPPAAPSYTQPPANNGYPPAPGGYPPQQPPYPGAPPPGPTGAPNPQIDSVYSTNYNQQTPYGGAPPPSQAPYPGASPYGGAPPPSPYGGAPPPSPYGGAPPPSPYGGAPPPSPYGGAPPAAPYGQQPYATRADHQSTPNPQIASIYNEPVSEEVQQYMNVMGQQPTGGPGPAYGAAAILPAFAFAQHQYTMQAPQGRRKALLVGINYFNDPRKKLNGCINDVHRMRQFLLQRGFVDDINSMCVLTDDQPNLAKHPTKANIIQGLQWLVSGAQPGDSIFFHYSGHGAQVQDNNGDEADGMDEVLVPVDANTPQGFIRDDDLHLLLPARIPPGCRLTSVMDCCHSGSGMDLPFQFEADHDFRPGENARMYSREQIKQHVAQLQSMKHQMPPQEWKRLKGQLKIMKKNKNGGMPGMPPPQTRNMPPEQNRGDVVLFSGCKDNQTSADVSGAGSAGGAMTNALLAVMGRNPNQTLCSLLFGMREELKRQGPRITQIPQLSSMKPINLQQPFVL